MAARIAVAPKTPGKAQRELEDLQLVLRARNGSNEALDGLMRKYAGFVRLKASSYFLAGGDGDDLVQEGMIGLYKAVRDFRPDKETSFRSFAELCVTRQIITAIKTATRYKHAPLNTYVSFSHSPAGQDSEGDCTLGDALPGPGVDDPSVCVISTEELQSLVFCLGSGLSQLESEALRLYLEGSSYESDTSRSLKPWVIFAGCVLVIVVLITLVFAGVRGLSNDVFFDAMAIRLAVWFLIRSSR